MFLKLFLNIFGVFFSHSINVPRFLIAEGIREKDRKGIHAILSQVGALKGNVYSLTNYLWNEVQENWKFCTQEELEIIRK